MALDVIQAAETINALENFIEKCRPREEIRDQLDIAYRIDNQSIIIYTIRPVFMVPGKKVHTDVAKATWVHTRSVWKIFWKRASGKWFGYESPSTVEKIEDFLKEVDADPHGCFWG